MHCHVLGVVVTDGEVDELPRASDTVRGLVVGQCAVAGALGRGVLDRIADVQGEPSCSTESVSTVSSAPTIVNSTAAEPRSSRRREATLTGWV